MKDDVGVALKTVPEPIIQPRSVDIRVLWNGRRNAKDFVQSGHFVWFPWSALYVPVHTRGVNHAAGPKLLATRGTFHPLKIDPLDQIRRDRESALRARLVES